MHWEYIPISIRCIRDNSEQAMSGVHIIIKSEPNNTIIDDFILTINHIDDVSDYTLLVNHVHEDIVYWYKCVIISETKVDTDPFSYFLNHGFNLFPRDQLGSSQITILKLVLASRHDYFNEVVHAKMLPFTLGQVGVGDHVKIVSSPFNFTNSLIFNQFVSVGNINYKLDKFFLTDVKYLENMNGGVVATKSNQSLGLIFGNLRKLNGDGDLTVIIPWKYVFTLIKHFLPPPQSVRRAANPKLNPKPKLSSAITSVIPLIIISSKGVSSWATCIYYNYQTLVTNRHVIEPFLNDGTCQIIFNDHAIQLTRKNLVIVPHEDIDLAFIFVNTRYLDDYTIVDPKFDLDVGEVVHTLSYGLFFNPNYIHPIQSEGIVNCVYELPVKEDSDLHVNSVIISSASSWNGSSGGGLFNNTGEFLGLICSNAQVKQPVLPDSCDMTEKLPKFSFILPVDIIEYFYNEIITHGITTVDISDKISDIWKLKSFHHDIIIEPAKL
ncbi:uncharacterized protein SPAPADRAFT_157314 [Spathaspora passalidarum NRRL Y-27907]|uniref:Serine protease n=1 Tax=Spathaspora passalidarum (strain NRRL Y-27907 / 11-Y1) TaxID=619300 RepID=G3ATZ6_SPAPN|nr:uncharacterized protein SPAPADRAFT_157314 [Spathaspora passalidarum NRRL Y-27907]EGW30372.1 hypothetical protein SPAPADRAFT_157314 [Spathaspora passalidarum NRRL Y-27907]